MAWQWLALDVDEVQRPELEMVKTAMTVIMQLEFSKLDSLPLADMMTMAEGELKYSYCQMRQK